MAFHSSRQWIREIYNVRRIAFLGWFVLFYHVPAV
jgi:hypothetical protein